MDVIIIDRHQAELGKFCETTRRLQGCGRLQRTNHLHSNVNHPETKSRLGHSSISAKQTAIRSVGGKWALTTRAKRCCSLHSGVKENPSSRSDAYRTVCRMGEGCCCLSFGAGAPAAAQEWHDDHSLSILATPSRRANKAQGRMRKGGQVAPPHRRCKLSRDAFAFARLCMPSVDPPFQRLRNRHTLRHIASGRCTSL